jgi:hypothetical protein
MRRIVTVTNDKAVVDNRPAFSVLGVIDILRHDDLMDAII